MCAWHIPKNRLKIIISWILNGLIRQRSGNLLQTEHRASLQSRQGFVLFIPFPGSFSHPKAQNITNELSCLKLNPINRITRALCQRAHGWFAYLILGTFAGTEWTRKTSCLNNSLSNLLKIRAKGEIWRLKYYYQHNFRFQPSFFSLLPSLCELWMHEGFAAWKRTLSLFGWKYK